MIVHLMPDDLDTFSASWTTSPKTYCGINLYKNLNTAANIEVTYVKEALSYTKQFNMRLCKKCEKNTEVVLSILAMTGKER